MTVDNPYLNVGIYSIPEASRLTGVSSQRINRWLYGYSYKNKENKRVSQESLWTSEVDEIHEKKALTFKDLIEIRFVDSFRSYGVSWKIIRFAAELACKKYNQSYPFSSQKFKTDGRNIFTEVYEISGEKKLLDIVREQWTFKRVIDPSLKGVEFSGEEAERWFPYKNSKLIVLDPKRSFGKPIITKEGVPTSTLAAAYKVEQDFGFVADCYEVGLSAVKAAVDFERHLAA